MTHAFDIKMGETSVFCRKKILVLFDVDVTTCIALFLTSIFHLKPFKKCPSPKIAKKALFSYSERI